jgi:hypothetical protein
MIKRSSLFVILFVSIASLAQTTKLPNGIYLNVEQLKNRTPAFDVNLSVVKRTSGDIFMLGGNDYKLISNVDSIDKKYIAKKVFAYVKSDSLFLNCFPHKLQQWYTLSDNSTGNYLVFKACMSLDRATSVAMFTGGLGAGFAAGKRYLYVLNLHNGLIIPLNEKTMLELLAGKSELRSSFQNSEDRSSEVVLREYIGKLNEL